MKATFITISENYVLTSAERDYRLAFTHSMCFEGISEALKPLDHIRTSKTLLLLNHP